MQLWISKLALFLWHVYVRVGLPCTVFCSPVTCLTMTMKVAGTLQKIMVSTYYLYLYGYCIYLFSQHIALNYKECAKCTYRISSKKCGNWVTLSLTKVHIFVQNSVKLGKYRTFDDVMSACGQFTDKKTPTHPLKWPLGAWSSFHLCYCILKKEIAKRPSRQCDELSGRARGSCSEVWALHVAINRPRGFDL